MSDILIPLGYDIDTAEKIATRPEDLSLIDRQKELALRRQGYMIQLQRIPLSTNNDLTKNNNSYGKKSK